MAIPLMNNTPRFAAGTDLRLPNSETEQMRLAQRDTLSAIGTVDFISDVLSFAPATVLSMADTFLSSFGVIDDNAMENWIAENTGGFGRSVARMQGTTQVAGDIGGMLIPGILASKAVRATGFLGRTAEKVLGPGATKYFSTGKSNKELFDSYFRRAQVLGEQRVKDLNAPGLGFALARRKAIGRSVADTMIEGVAADAAIALSMNSSDFLFPDEMTLVDNLGWMAGTNAVVGVGASLIARQVMKSGVREAYATGRAMSSTKSDWVAQMSPSNIVGNRGAAIAVHALLLDEAKSRLTAAYASADGNAVTTMKEEIEGITGSLAELTRYSFQDSPIEGVTKSYSFKHGDNSFGPYLRTMQAAYDTDPHMAFGLRSLETYNTSTPVEFAERYDTALETARVKMKENQTELKSLIKLKNPSFGEKKKMQRLRKQQSKLMTQIDDLSSTVPLVVEIDGTSRAMSKRAEMWHDGNREIIKFAKAGSGVELDNKMILADFSGNVSIGPKKKDATFDIDDETGQILGDVTKLDSGVWQSLSHKQRTATFDALQNSAERLNIATWTGAELKGKPHFTQLDYLLNVVQRHGDAALKKIQGVDSVDDIRFASLASKFEEYQLLRNQAAQDKSGNHIYADLNNVARALNLPNTDFPLLHFFESLRTTNPNVLMKLEPIVKSMQGLEDGLKKFLSLEKEAKPLAGMKYEGNMLNMPQDRKPVLAVMRNLENRAELGVEDLRAQVTKLRAMQAETLRKAEGTVIVKNLMDVMDGMNDVFTDFQQRLQSVVHGNDGFGTFERNVAQQSFRFRDEPAFQAALMIADVTERQVDKMIEGILKSPISRNNPMTHQQLFNKLMMQENAVHLDSFFTLRHALGQGWDLAEKGRFVRVASNAADKTGIYHAVLDSKSERNKALYFKIFGTEMPEDSPVYLPLVHPETGTIKPVAITEMGLQAAVSMNNLSQQLLREVNAMRKARNMQALPRKAFHLPPIDFSRANREYLFDYSGNFVVVVGADTKAELNRLVEKEIEAAGGKLVRMTEADIDRHYGARAEAFFKMVDYSKPSNQTGPATGRSFGGVIRTGTNEFNAMLESMLRGYSDIGRELRTLRLDPEIQYLKMMKRSSGIPDNTRTVFDELITTINGSQYIDPTTVVGKALNFTESVYDNIVQSLHDSTITSKSVIGLDTLANRRATKLFGATADALPANLNPFKSVEDYLVRTNNTGIAPTLRKHAALLNEITAALSIRMFDIGMGVINLLSLTTTLPPVVAALARRAGESDAQYRARVGIFGTITPKGRAYFSPAKAGITGLAFRNSKEGKEMLERAAARGFLDQAAAEQTEIWGRSGESFTGGKLREFAQKVSKWTDWTERESRTIAFSTFYRIGREGLGLQDNAAMLFAHRQANNVIADFRPANRPAIFQGAAGMPLGLFTTYMWNYWQRIISMVENKSIRAGVWQAGLQGSLFGAESLPGWDLYTSTFMENYDGSHNVVDRFNTAFGNVGADVFLNGSISNLPRLFGAPDGISVGPRASVGVPFESGFGAQSVAGLRMLTRIGSTMGQIVDSAIEQQGIDPTRTAEILATANINKFMTNVIDGVVGHAVDYTGNVIEDDTRSLMGIASRVVGFKPLMTDELRQENVRNRATDRIQTELKDRLAENLKSRIRNGKLREEDVELALEHYVRAGGNAENFRRFFQSQIHRATTTKVDLEILDALRGSIDEGRIGRLLYLSRD